MRTKVEKLILRASKVAELIKSYPGVIRIVSHYDCDGICSAAIITKALERERKSFRLSFIKQLYEADVKELAKDKLKLMMFLDLGSGQLETIQSHMLETGKKIIIADHHQIEGEVISENVLHINPLTFGIEDNVSGSGVAYIIARALNPENRDLSEIGVIGAIGDSQVGAVGADWGLFGLNKEIQKDAENENKIKIEKGLRLWGKHTRPVHKALEYSVDPYIPGISGSESGSVNFLQEIGIELKNDKGGWRTMADLAPEEQKRLASGIIKERVMGNEENPEWIFGDSYILLDKKEFSDANEFATLLNACGKLGMGYMGIALCLNDRESFKKVDAILDNYRKEIGKAMSWIYGNQDIIKKTEKANYIVAGDRISEHVISNVVSIVQRAGIVPDKPTFALVNTEDGKVKISARASDGLVEKGLNLRRIMVEACKGLEGEAGGHLGAAGGTIEAGLEERFINSIESIISNISEGELAKDADSADDSNGTAKSEDGREAGGSGEAGGEASSQGDGEGKDHKKVEGKGLVRYIGS